MQPIPGRVDREDESLVVVALQHPRYRGRLLVFTVAELRRALDRGIGWQPRHPDPPGPGHSSKPQRGRARAPHRQPQTGRQRRRAATSPSAAAQPILGPLRRLLADAGGRWSGTSVQLCEALERRASAQLMAEPRWPRSARAMVHRLDQVAPLLAVEGWTVSYHGQQPRIITMYRGETP